MKRVLITGASSGIGCQLARHYLSSGDHVIACGRNREKLAASFADHSNSKLELGVFDVTDHEDTLSAMQAFQHLDLVILNAGTCEYIDQPKQFDSALFNRVLETNVVGTVNCLEAVLGNIKAGGQLAIVSSSVTLLPITRAEAYGASKAALDYLTRTLAIDLTPHDIHVSLIRPGFVKTPLTDKNNFDMPGIISPEKACQYIVEGLSKRKRIINFPPFFYLALKTLSLLPNALWHHLGVKMIRKEHVK